MSEAFNKSLLLEASRRPCACGKRRRADKQKIVAGPSIESHVVGSDGETAEGLCRASCRMECLVCHDVHKFVRLFPVPRGVIEMRLKIEDGWIVYADPDGEREWAEPSGDECPACYATFPHRHSILPTGGALGTLVERVEVRAVDRFKDMFDQMAKGNTFECAVCGETFTKGASEQDAVSELHDYFGDVPLEECEMVCDDCFQKIHPQRN